MALVFAGVCTGIDSQKRPIECPPDKRSVGDAASATLRAREMFPTVNSPQGILGWVLPGPDWVWPGQTWWQRIDPRVNGTGLLNAWIRSRYLLMSSGMLATQLDFKPEVLIGVVGMLLDLILARATRLVTFPE